jgi:hypothetical protein
MSLLAGSKRQVLPQGFDHRSHTEGLNIELPRWQRQEALAALVQSVCGQEARVVQQAFLVILTVLP